MKVQVQPEFFCSLIGAFVVRCLDGIIPKLLYTISFKTPSAASVAVHAGLNLTWSQTLQDILLSDVAQLLLFPLQVLLTKLFERLELKEKPFKTFPAASSEALGEMWARLDSLGNPITCEMKQQTLEKEVKSRYEHSFRF